ncbi:MAG: BREX system P-loop protein BrxC [Vicinamibacterales bacterium]
MTRIAELLDRDFSRPIEEIIKVNNDDEDTVYTELTEYVATDRIKAEYERLFAAMAAAPGSPNEGVGVWISGFFGSGKSSFAKNLGYVLANRPVRQTPASELFLKQVDSHRLGEYVEFLNKAVPYEVFMFDVQVDLSVQTSAEQIAEVMYRVLLRSLDYAEDYDIAELEIELEAEAKLDGFQRVCREIYKDDWRRIRKGSQKYARASALLHELDRKTYASSDTWLEIVKHRPSRRLSVKDVVDRSFELCARRRPGKAFAFVVDEMGQYVARSGERLENLRAVVEQFGKESLNRLKARTISGPAWMIVTAQEKLQDVYNYLATGRIDLPKLQDRFKYQIDLSPADIREVATRRVLRKKPSRESILRKLFQDHGATLLQSVKLEKSSRRTDFDEEAFVQFYPYLPHLIDLSIDIMTGIRLQPHTPKHLGGSNRTIIKQSFEMLVSDRTRLADAPLGTLVSIDKIYELVEGNIPSEKQKDILDVRQRFDSDMDYPGLASRVAKAICLMEFARTDLPRTTRNIAALLVQHVTEAPPVLAVASLLERLKQSQFVRETEDGWKLQTAHEKNWEQEKRGQGAPNRNERAEILRGALREVFENAKALRVHYRNLRSFDLAILLDGQSVTAPGKTARIPVHLSAVYESEDFPKRCGTVGTESLEQANRDAVHWVFPLTRQTETLIEDFHASRRMIAKYEHAASQQHLREGDRALLEAERTQRDRLSAQLLTTLEKNLEAGAGFFRGLRFEAGDLGKDLASMMRALAEKAIPDLYPKLEMGSREVDGSEAEEFLKQTNLGALPPLFHAGQKGLHLVTKEGGRFVPNARAEIAQEILTNLKREHSYGEKVTGAKLLDQFGGVGYGWSPDVIRLVVAVLFRAGSIEVAYQGRRYRNYQEPQARTPLVTLPAFRSASFSPRESIDLKTLTKAVQELEAMVGHEVDVEESAIAEEFRKLARAEREQALPALAQVRAHGLPLAPPLGEYVESLDAVLASQSDDCVRMLAGEGRSFREQREQVQRIRAFLTDQNIEVIRRARVVLREQAPLLARSLGRQVPEAETIRTLLADAEIVAHAGELRQAAETVDSAYRARFADRHHERLTKFQESMERIRASADYRALDAEEAEAALAPLARRAVETFELAPFTAADAATGATLATLEGDLELLQPLEAGALARLAQLREAKRESDEAVEVIRLGDFLPKTQPLSDFTDEEIEAALDKLRQKLYALRELKRRALWD